MVVKFIEFFYWVALLLLLAAGMPISAAAAQVEMKPERLNVFFTDRAFLGVNPLDVEADFNVFVRTVRRTHGYQIQSTGQRIESVLDLEAIPDDDQPNLIILDSWSYLSMENTHWFEPLFVASDRGQVSNRYLLLARREDAIKKLIDLRGKSLNLFATAKASLGSYWLQALFQEQKLGRPEAFFGELAYHTDPMSAVLQVFFGKKDAALVDSSKFELMAEMNPQLSGLQTLAVSEPLVNAVICLKRSRWSSERFKQDLIQALTELHRDPPERQLLTLFKVQQLTPFEPKHLDTVRQLHEQVTFRQSEYLDPSKQLINIP